MPTPEPSDIPGPDSFTSTIMITQPAYGSDCRCVGEGKGTSAVKKLPEGRLANAPSMAPAEMDGNHLALPFDIKWLTFVHLIAEQEGKNQSASARTAHHGPYAAGKCHGIHGLKYFPDGLALNPAAMAFKLTELINDRRIHATGARMVTSRDIMVTRITTDGPMDDITLLLDCLMYLVRGEGRLAGCLYRPFS